jgi:gluconate 2-dehydrogenase gamma chain
MTDWYSSRRTFLQQGALGLGFALLSAVTPEALRAAHASASKAADANAAFRFFTADEAADVIAFGAQIIPTDDTPGATEAHAVYFIDHALIEFAPEDQVRVRTAIHALNDLAAKHSAGASARFAHLSSAEQFELTKKFQSMFPAPDGGYDPSNNGMNSSGSNCFELLRTYIITGFLSDPDLGGNKDMIGWKVIGFDGNTAHQPPFGYYDAELLKSQALGEEKK